MNTIRDIFSNVVYALRDIANPSVHIDIRLHHLAMLGVGFVGGFIVGAAVL